MVNSTFYGEFDIHLDFLVVYHIPEKLQIRTLIANN